ncbi:hypothetical protein PGT21_034897 [Puccinia graminis f. sp. tritici]|uniref:Uncharacterized protein n=1 Tax=Puccinia graminis f. sp. tritici TaxID=56615 RepID=A0A5B0P1L4_PUCGR|nr:hypothetical protein PGT21_034897 [Puccinia graminis f. sp. tritici]
MTINKTSTALKEPSERLSSEDSSPGDSSSDDSSSDDSSSGDSSGPDHRERREGRSEKPSDKKNENSPIPKTVDLSDCRKLGGE